MPAANPKCHQKHCQCADCVHICSRCNVSGRCPDTICKSEHGMQDCELYAKEEITKEVEFFNLRYKCN